MTEAEEAAIIAFRPHTLLPFDDCLYALQPTITHLRRSTLHRCLQQHGISRLPDLERDEPKRQRFERYPPASSTWIRLVNVTTTAIATAKTAPGTVELRVPS